MQHLTILSSKYWSFIGGMLMLGGFLRNLTVAQLPAPPEGVDAVDYLLGDASRNFAAPTEPKILVLGWYERRNLGDDCFVDAFRSLFRNVSFACTDDIDAIPSDVDIVVCGGGDIVNPYFMAKIDRLLYDFEGACYGVGIGVPFDADAPRMLTFDHCFMRSHGDLQLCAPGTGTYTADLSWLLTPPAPRADLLSLARPQIGFCLAQPAFQGPAASQLLASVAEVIRSLVEDMGCDVHLLTFNASDSPSESDAQLNARLRDELVPESCRGGVVVPAELTTREDVMAYVGGMRALLCMRYHAVQFALQMRRPFVAMYSTSKVHKLLQDAGFEAYGYRLPTDGSSRPTAIDAERVVALLDMCVREPNVLAEDMPVASEAIRSTVFDKLRRANVSFDALAVPPSPASAPPAFPRTLEDARARCVTYVARLTGHTEAEVRDWFYNGGTGLTMTTTNARDNVARTMLLATTGHVASQYVWGMCDQMQREGAAFKPVEAIDWVYGDARTRNAPCPLPEFPHPIDICVDLTYYLQDDFKEFHRSGWSYCIGGLMRFDTSVLRRRPSVRVDTYVDRTFHWGKAALKAAGIVPYTQPWMGFIHHTFEESHGPNNCVTLFHDADFLESLASCRCLIVLSEYLAEQVRASLTNVGCGSVPVEVMTHAMEFVPEELCWDLAKFSDNPSPKIVSIGAWLRNPYAIYELQTTQITNKITVTKAILNGKDMSCCMPPEWLPSAIDDLAARSIATGDGVDDGICRTPAEGVCRQSDDGGICRPPGGMCRSAVCDNKIVAGMVDMLHRQLNSVEIIPRLDNDQYDQLLASNIVFLNLVDASAVNTVLECIVRNTPFVVNRLPALVELLPDYPGFYDDELFLASQILMEPFTVCYQLRNYLASMDKTKFMLSTFQQRFVEIVKAHQ